MFMQEDIVRQSLVEENMTKNKHKEIEEYLNTTEVITLRDKWLIELLKENKQLKEFIAVNEYDLKPTKLEDKSKLILKFTQEIVDEAKNREDNIGGAMRTFGNEYVIRMTTFNNFFKGI